jgi:hypothetical protein
MSLDVELQHKSRTVVFVLDSFATHPHLDPLKNIQLEYLSPNISLVQPVDLGIIKKSEDFISLKVGKLHF